MFIDFSIDLKLSIPSFNIPNCHYRTLMSTSQYPNFSLPIISRSIRQYRCGISRLVNTKKKKKYQYKIINTKLSILWIKVLKYQYQIVITKIWALSVESIGLWATKCQSHTINSKLDAVKLSIHLLQTSHCQYETTSVIFGELFLLLFTHFFLPFFFVHMEKIQMEDGLYIGSIFVKEWSPPYRSHLE